MNTRNTLALCVMFALCSGSALAKDEGFYVGASLGSASIQQSGSDPDLGDFDIDENDFAWKIFGGYQFNPIFAVEGGYVDLGSPSNSGIKVEPYGLDLFAVAGIPLGPIRGFGKLGAIYWDADTLVSDHKFNEDSFDFAGGVGLEFELGSFAIRGEVEYLDVLDETWMYTIGGTFTF